MQASQVVVVGSLGRHQGLGTGNVMILRPFLKRYGDYSYRKRSTSRRAKTGMFVPIWRIGHAVVKSRKERRERLFHLNHERYKRQLKLSGVISNM
jgi:hypothetical protein